MLKVYIDFVMLAVRHEPLHVHSAYGSVSKREFDWCPEVRQGLIKIRKDDGRNFRLSISGSVVFKPIHAMR
jgi:hypothetical protein